MSLDRYAGRVAAIEDNLSRMTEKEIDEMYIEVFHREVEDRVASGHADRYDIDLLRIRELSRPRQRALLQAMFRCALYDGVCYVVQATGSTFCIRLKQTERADMESHPYTLRQFRVD